MLPAFCEELLFRGVLLNACENGMGSIRAVFTVGFCFALFHGSPEQTVYQFIAGCVFAFVAVRSRSVTPSVLMHFINNALIVILGACGLYGEGGRNGDFLPQPISRLTLLPRLRLRAGLYGSF